MAAAGPLDSAGGAGVGSGRFNGSPERPEEVSRMRAPGDHETNASPAPSAARPAKPGPLRHLPPQRAVVLSGNPTPSPPPPQQPKLLDHDLHPCPESRPRGRPEPGRPPAGSRPAADGNRLHPMQRLRYSTELSTYSWGRRMESHIIEHEGRITCQTSSSRR